MQDTWKSRAANSRRKSTFEWGSARCTYKTCKSGYYDPDCLHRKELAIRVVVAVVVVVVVAVVAAVTAAVVVVDAAAAGAEAGARSRSSSRSKRR